MIKAMLRQQRATIKDAMKYELHFKWVPKANSDRGKKIAD